MRLESTNRVRADGRQGKIATRSSVGANGFSANTSERSECLVARVRSALETSQHPVASGRFLEFGDTLDFGRGFTRILVFSMGSSMTHRNRLDRWDGCSKLVLLTMLLATDASFPSPLRAANDEPTHREVEAITFELGAEGRLETIGMNRDGELLASVTWLIKKPEAKGDPPASNDPAFWDYWDEHREVRVLDSHGTLKRKIEIPKVIPLQLVGTDDGSIYIGGEYRIVRIAPDGTITEKAKIVDVIPNTNKDTHVSGIAATDKYLFVAIGTGRSLRATEEIVRLTRDLKEPKVIVDRQFGCCSHIDMAVHGETLYVAENSRHRVNLFSFEGELLSQFGKRDRTGIEGFAACCNPVNFDIAGNKIVTAESGIGRVKSFDLDGHFQQLIGYVDTTKFDRGSRVASLSCYIPVEVGPGGDRIYVMDVRARSIRVLERVQ